MAEITRGLAAPLCFGDYQPNAKSVYASHRYRFNSRGVLYDRRIKRSESYLCCRCTWDLSHFRSDFTEVEETVRWQKADRRTEKQSLGDPFR